MQEDSGLPTVIKPLTHLQREDPDSSHSSPHPISACREEQALNAREVNTRHLSLSSGMLTPTPSSSSKAVMFETPDGVRRLSTTPGNGHKAE